MDYSNFSYVNDDGKLVSGAAAFLHYVYTVKGGVCNYNNEVGEMFLKTFMQEFAGAINAEIAAQARRSQLKLVG